MKEPSSEQLYREALGAYNSARPVNEAPPCERALRNVISVLRPIIAGEVLREPSDHELSACVEGTIDDHDLCVKKAFSNRLAAMTVPSDPAVEAVSKLMWIGKKIIRTKMHEGNTWIGITPEIAAEIVAAVDDARKK